MRIVASPFVMGLFAVFYFGLVIKSGVHWIFWGGEMIAYGKDTRATIVKVYDKLENDLAQQSQSESNANALKNSKNLALYASLSAIYFRDSSDYLSKHYDVVRRLTGIQDLPDEVINELYKKIGHG